MVASEVLGARSRSLSLIVDSCRASQTSRQASLSRISIRIETCPSTLMSARIPFTVRLLSALPLEGLLPGEELCVRSIQFGLYLGRVAAGDALEDLLIHGKHLFPVLLEVTDQGLDFDDPDAKRDGDRVGTPALQDVRQDVVDGDADVGQLGAPAAVNDLHRFHVASGIWTESVP